MQIAQSKTREQFPLSKKKILKKTINGVSVWIVATLIFYVPFALGLVSNVETIGWLGWLTVGTIGFLLLVCVFVILPVYLYQRWYYAVYFYDLTPDNVVIRKGPITPREITIPYERIQDVYVDQDILDRIFGLYDVHLSSATASSGMEAHIDGVEKQAADGLRAVLLQKISEKIGKHKGVADAINHS